MLSSKYFASLLDVPIARKSLIKSQKLDMGYLVDSSSHYILGVGVPALVASTIVL